MKSMTKISALILAIALTALYAQDVAAHRRITTDVKWSKDPSKPDVPGVREILRKKCMICHHEGGIAPDYVDLTRHGEGDDFGGAWAWAASIEEEIVTGRMPPWKPDGRFGAFANSKLLTEEEKEYILAWVSGGVPQGPQRNLPTPPEFLNPDWEFGEPDVVFELPEEFVLPANQQYASLTTTFPVDLEEDSWITAYEFFPMNPKNIYSMTAYIVDPEGAVHPPLEVEMQVEYDPLADEDDLNQTRLRDMPAGRHYLGQWLRGDEAVLMPEAGGRMLRKGSKIELEIQYDRPAFAEWTEEIRDKSKFGIFLSEKADEIDILVESMEIANNDFSIPANEENHEVSVEITTHENVHLIALNPQLGLLAKDLRVNIHYPDGLSKTLMWIPEYKRQFNSSYQFAEPIAAPKGSRIELVAHYNNTEDNWVNPNSPPAIVKSGQSPTDEQLRAWIDYTLDDHLIVEVPFVPRPVAPREGQGMTIFTQIGGEMVDVPDDATELIEPKEGSVPEIKLAIDDKDTWWCPMRGNPCALKDFHEEGDCPECGMGLHSKLSFFEGQDVAPESAPWDITEEGFTRVYWCPNRSREDHILVDYSSPGKCSVCAEDLLHQSRFVTQHTWTCVTPICSNKGSLFYGPGLCPICGQPVTGMGHMDHTPLHGGQFFMADNLFHHLEGTLPEEGLFKLYLYDDWKVPLDARNILGKLFFEHEDGDTGEVTETEFELYVAKDGDTFLVADLPTQLPLIFYTKVWLAGKEKRFDFDFEETTVEPEKNVTPALDRYHSHKRDSVVIPPTPEGIVAEIFKRDRQIKALLDGEDYLGLHYPSFDAKDFMAALATNPQGLNVRQRGALKKAVGLINRGANSLDLAGDTNDAGRAQRAYVTFTEGVQALKGIYPTVD